MSDDVPVPCGREWWCVDENGYRGRFICSDPPRRCPNCTELLALRQRVAELERGVTESQLQLVIDAAGLCQSEANRWDGRPSYQKTADHWQHVATELKATYLLAHGLMERVAELEATAARRLELLRPFATAYDAWVAADSDTAIEITPDQARAAAAEVAASLLGVDSP